MNCRNGDRIVRRPLGHKKPANYPSASTTLIAKNYMKSCQLLLISAVLASTASGQLGWLSVRSDEFVPKNRLSGIGADRQEMPEIVLAKRTELMIESQTFSIMRHPDAIV